MQPATDIRPRAARAGRRVTLMRLLLLLLLPLACATAQASCNVSPALPYLSPLPNIVVASSLGIGETIPGTPRNYQFSGTCNNQNGEEPGATIIACYYGSGSEVMPGVYSTGVGGIGIRLRNASGVPIINAKGIYCDSRYASVGNLDAQLAYSFSVSIEFVKTAATVSAGSLDPAQTRFGLGVYGTGTGLGGNVNYIGFSAGVAPRQVTCQVDYPANITLPAISSASLNAGTGTSSVTRFSISLRCDDSLRVGITFDGAPGTPVKSSSDGIFGSLNEGSPGFATGVGVQLLDASSSSPVPLQQRLDLGSLATNERRSYPYALQYRRLGGPVMPGLVSGAAIFTFDYQ